MPESQPASKGRDREVATSTEASPNPAEQSISQHQELTTVQGLSTRRQFLAATSSIVLSAAVAVSGAETVASPDIQSPTQDRFSAAELFEQGPQRSFSGDRAMQIAMPIGGIGAGCVCLNGYGGLQDFSISNRPTITALPQGFAPSKAAFAILHIKGSPPTTKLVEGPFPALKLFDQGLQGEGYRRGGFEGFPRFTAAEFKGEYPFGELKMGDPSIPLQVMLSAWNPFIPLDDRNSGISCAVLEYTLHNVSAHTVD